MSGLVDGRGKPRYLLDVRMRVSRQLDLWLTKLTPEMARQSAVGTDPPAAERADFVRELQRIALGQDVGARVADRLTAIKELLKLGDEGTSSYLVEDEYDFGRLSNDELDAVMDGLAALRAKARTKQS